MGLRGHVHAYVPYDLSIDSSQFDPSNRGIEVLPLSFHPFLSLSSFLPVLFLLFRVVAYEARDTSAASGRVRDVILVLYYTGRPTLPIWSRIGVVDVRSQWSKSIRSSEFNPRNPGDQWTISVHVCGLK